MPLSTIDWITVTALSIAAFALFDDWRVRRALRAILAAQRRAARTAATAEAGALQAAHPAQADTTSTDDEAEATADAERWCSVGFAVLGDPENPFWRYHVEGRRRALWSVCQALYERAGDGCAALRDTLHKIIAPLDYECGRIPAPHTDDQKILLRAGEIHAGWELFKIDTTRWGHETLLRLYAQYNEGRDLTTLRTQAVVSEDGAGDHDHVAEPIVVAWPRQTDSEDVDPDQGPYARAATHYSPSESL